MNNLLAVHVVAAARQRYPQLLPGLNHVGIRYIINGLDLWEGDQAGEDLGSYAVEGVAGDHRVVGAAVGYSGAVGADAGEGNLDRLGGGDGEGGWRGEREVVGSKNRAEVLDGEEGSDGGESGGVGGDVVDESIAGGGGGAAEEGLLLGKAEV